MNNRNYKILICYNEPFVAYDNYSGKYSENGNNIDLSDSEFFTHLHDIQKLLLKNFNSVELQSIGANLYDNINKITEYNPDIIFNFVESIEGIAEYEIYVAGLFDILEIAYTGNNGLTLANCLNKYKSKQILSSYGINTPQFGLVQINDNYDEIISNFAFPLILKLNREDASIGISEQSVVRNREECLKRLDFLFSNYNQEIIIEEYIEGREFNVAIMDDTILPISEIDFNGLPSNLPKIVTYEAKWSPGTLYYSHTSPVCPANISVDTKKALEDTAWRAFVAMECRDYARVDIRLNYEGVPYVIEVNPNPDISEDSGFVRAANAAGISYENLIIKLADLAKSRIYEYDTETEENGQTTT